MLEAAGNDPADAPDMVLLFRLAHVLPPMVHAIDLWTRGDALMMRQKQVAAQLHDLVSGGPADRVRVAVLLRKLDAPLVHVQTASRGSFWRKFVVCLLARAARRPHGVPILRSYRRGTSRG